MKESSQMKKEILECPRLLMNLYEYNRENVDNYARIFSENKPSAIYTFSRGSSLHASMAFHMLAAKHLALYSNSFPLALTGSDETQVQLKNTSALFISQSGESPDLIKAQEYIAKQSIPSLCLSNTETSTLYTRSPHKLSMKMEKEESVAATKTFIASLYVLTHLVLRISKNELFCLHKIPEILDNHQLNLNTHPEFLSLANTKNLFVISRGFGLSIAHETALKLKETCGIMAQAYSSAEIKHGPIGVLNHGDLVLILALRDQHYDSHLKLADELRTIGVKVVLVEPKINHLLTENDLPILQSISLIHSIYIGIEQISQDLGKNPDQPKHLKKVTKTF